MKLNECRNFFSNTIAAGLSVAFVASVGFGQAANAEVISPLALYQNGWNAASVAEKNQDENYADFLSQSFYGAFAMSKDGYSYWYAGFHDLDTARTAVLAWCEDDSPAEGRPCEIAAYLVPSYIPEGFISGLSAPAIGELEEFMGYGGEKSFAISANGAYAYTWDYGTAREADNEAISLCNESAEEKVDWMIGQSAGCILFDYIGATATEPTAGEQLLQRPTKK